MTEPGITEAGTVQFPMVRHAAKAGWTPLTPQEALARRGGMGGMLFRGELETALRRFNPSMADDAVRSTIERLEALPPTIEGNRDAIERGITQLRRYEQQTPELIAAAQLFNVTHLLDYWYGVTWNASHRFMPGF